MNAQLKERGATNLTGDNVPSDSANGTIAISRPYRALIAVRGDAPILFHRYQVDEVEAKANARKGSAAKKTENPEAYVYRNPEGELCIPGDYLRMAMIETAKSYQDPRSSRRSAWGLFRAGVLALTPLASLGVKDWDALDKRRVVVNRGAVPRIRPCMMTWETEFMVQVILPEYIAPQMLHSVASDAGKFCGLGDFRPTYGRFSVVRFEGLSD